MRLDEFRRDVVIGQIPREHGMDNTDRKVLMNLEVEMGSIKPVRVSNRTDLLSARNLLPFPDQDAVEVCVQRISVLNLAVFHKGVPDHDDVSPSPTEISSERHDAVSNRIDWITEIGTAPSLPNPVLAQVAMSRESARNPVSIRIRFSDRIIKTVRQPR